MKTLILVALSVLLVPQLAAAGAYHGQVVDAATGAPLSDAVVVLWWVKAPIIHMDGPVYFHEAKEALTDGEGRFSLSPWRKPDLNPFTVVQTPHLIVFKPGYEPLCVGFWQGKGLTYDDWRGDLRRGARLMLPRLRPEQDDPRSKVRGLVTGLGELGMAGDIREGRFPNLFRLINVDRRRHGLGPIGTPSGGSDR